MGNKKPNNESAFPEPFVNDPNLSISHTKGMTLRDYFAAKAMQGLVSNSGWMAKYEGEKYLMPIDNIVDTSYEIADAMLKHRENGDASK